MTGVQGCRNLGGQGEPDQPKGADYAHHITTRPPPPDFQTFRHPWSERVSAVEVTYLLTTSGL